MSRIRTTLESLHRDAVTNRPSKLYEHNIALLEHREEMQRVSRLFVHFEQSAEEVMELTRLPLPEENCTDEDTMVLASESLEIITRRLGVEKPRISQESLKDTIIALWRRLVNALQVIWRRVVDFIRSVLKTIRKNNQDVTAEIKSLQHTLRNNPDATKQQPSHFEDATLYHAFNHGRVVTPNDLLALLEHHRIQSLRLIEHAKELSILDEAGEAILTRAAKNEPVTLEEVRIYLEKRLALLHTVVETDAARHASLTLYGNRYYKVDTEITEEDDRLIVEIHADFLEADNYDDAPQPIEPIRLASLADLYEIIKAQERYQDTIDALAESLLQGIKSFSNTIESLFRNAPQDAESLNVAYSLIPFMSAFGAELGQYAMQLENLNLQAHTAAYRYVRLSQDYYLGQSESQ